MSTSVKLPFVVLAGCLLCTLILVAGCPPATPPADQGTPLAAPAKPASATPEAAAQPGDFKWTETPTLEMIPSKPLTGMIHGKPFEIKMVRLEHSMDELALVMADTKPDTATSSPMEKVGAEISIKLPEGKAGKMLKALKDSEDPKKTGHAWFHWDQGGSKGPMSENPQWAAALEITEWKLAKDPKDENVVGHLKGKLVICFGDDAKSWVAGTFDCIEMK